MALNKDRVFKAAENYIKKNRIDKAIAEYESWLKENPKDWNIIRTVGDLYARISRNDEAIKKYAQVADHYRKDGFNVRAIATHKMVLRLDPQNEPAMRNLAELQAEEGLLMEAKSYYQTLVELYNKQGHKRAAAEVFKKLAEIDPQDVKIRYKYADFLNKNGKPDEASREYVGIADQFIGQGLVDEAIKILEQGRTLQTADPALKIKLAQACSMQGNHSQAIRLLEEVRKSASGDPAILGRLGEAYLAAGNTDDAEMIFQQLAKVQPGNPENVLRLADLRLAQSKFDTALDELSPLVDRHVSQGEGQKATELLSKVLSKDPHHIKSLLKLAEIHTILKQDTGRVAAYDSLCEAYNRAGDFEKAVSVAERLVEIDPESSQHKDRLKFFKSKLAGSARAPEPIPRPAPVPPPRPAAPPPKPVAPPRVEAQPAPSPPPRPAPPKPPISEISDIPDFGSFNEVLSNEDLSQAVESSFPDLDLDEEKPSTGAAAIDLGDLVELSQEEEENIKEKLIEAEVFVRYGLVDKAIGQLVDVLESFRFHVETREKLIEIYRDQGMNREAGEQLMHLAQVYDRLGRSPEAGRARQEAAELSPALAAQMAAPAIEIEEEPELILATETESDLGDAGIEIDIASMEEERPVFAEMSPPSEAEIAISFDDAGLGEPEIDVSLDEPAEALSGAPPLSDEAPIEVDWGAAGSDFGGRSEAATPDSEDSIDLTGAVEVEVEGEEEGISVSIGEELPEEAEFASTGLGGEVAIEAGPEEIEINLEASSAEIPISIEEPMEEPVRSTSALDDEFEMEIADEVSEGEPSAAFDEEFSVDLGEEEGPSVGVAPSTASEPVEPLEEETFSSFDASSDDGPDFQIDIPGAADVEMDLSDLANLGLADEEAIEVEDLPPPASRVAEPRQAAPALKASPRPEPPPAPKAAPAPEPPPPARTAKSPLAAELDEVDEYIALGLYEDARDTLRELLKKHSGQPEILAKIEELGFSSEQIQKEAKEPARLLKTPAAGAPEKKPAEAPPSPRGAKAPEPIPSPIPSPIASDEEVEFAEASLGDEFESLVDLSEPEAAVLPRTAKAEARPAAAQSDFIDLASELSEEIFGTHSAMEEEESEPEGPLTDPGLDQIFREFRKGVEKQLGAEDYDTRYNLGIAYKEMGLLDEAIAEFQLAAKDEVRSLECCSMLGLCFMEKGIPDIAIKWFSKGLAIPGRREEEYHGLRYDLAQAYEAAGQPDRALELYMEIFRENIKFRDVQERVKELQAARK
jgi:tetratricopeptide (TPR) repeat protein